MKTLQNNFIENEVNENNENVFKIHVTIHKSRVFVSLMRIKEVEDERGRK